MTTIAELERALLAHLKAHDEFVAIEDRRHAEIEQALVGDHEVPGALERIRNLERLAETTRRFLWWMMAGVGAVLSNLVFQVFRWVVGERG
jgi:hypothetical protein